MYHIHAASNSSDLAMAKHMALNFAKASPYEKYIEPDVVESVIKGAMEGQDSVVLICGNLGMIVMTILPFIYGSERMAVELAWWVEPAYRKGGLGRTLLTTAEQWAKSKGAVGITMISLDDNLGSVYEQHGYTLRERTYMKEL